MEAILESARLKHRRAIDRYGITARSDFLWAFVTSGPGIVPQPRPCGGGWTTQGSGRSGMRRGRAGLGAAARFGGNQIRARARFLRVPVLPYGAALYTYQVTQAAARGDVPATFRLSLLPYLASAAALAYKMTGSDKGVW